MNTNYTQEIQKLKHSALVKHCFDTLVLKTTHFSFAVVVPLRLPEKTQSPPQEEISGHFLDVESLPATSSTSNHSEDDDHQFLMSLYPHFKKVPQVRKLPLRMKMEQIIYEATYGTSSKRNEMS